MGIDKWQPAEFASHFRQKDPEPPVERWEELLRAEQSFAYQLLDAAARSPRWSRLLRVPFELGSGSSLAEREARVKAMRNSRLGRWLERPRPQPEPPVSEVYPDRPPLPPVGRHLDGEVDAALALLTSMAFEEIQRRGWHLQPAHFYWPLNDLDFLRGNRKLWADPRMPREIDWDLDGQLELAQRLATYSGELAGVREGTPVRPGDFAWGQAFSGLDAYAYYGLIRDLQPARVVEVGAGTSSTLLARAIAANGQPCEVTLIEPAPRWNVLGELPEHWQMLPSLVQHVDQAVFAQLQAGDVLFYDGSHCAGTGSDVNWMFFEVLPSLQPGVWIHVHDTFWPSDYWSKWIFDEGLSWNEQYFVQAFLMHNDSYRVRFSSSMLHHYKLHSLEEVFPGNIAEAGSLWMEKVS